MRDIYAGLRSEEIKLPEAICCCSNEVVVMEMMLHTCVPSSISMHGTVSDFEELIFKKSA